jgi:hypothetical protein
LKNKGVIRRKKKRKEKKKSFLYLWLNSGMENSIFPKIFKVFVMKIHDIKIFLINSFFFQVNLYNCNVLFRSNQEKKQQYCDIMISSYKRVDCK